MLIQFSLSNFGSFRDEQTFSFVASAYSEYPEWVIEKEVPGLSGYSYLSTAGIFGANASGKSMFIDAVSVFRRIVRESASMMPDESLLYNPFRLNQGCADKETSFEIVFEYKSKRYDYSFSYNASKIMNEELYRYETKLPQLLFRVSRSQDGDVELQTTSRMAKLKKHREYLRSKPNSLLLSRGAQEGVEELVAPYTWISTGLLIYDAPFDHTDMSIYGPVIEGKFGEEMRNRLISLARRADLGISDIKAKDVTPIPEDQLTAVFTPEMAKRIIGTPTKTALFIHEGARSDVEFSASDESVGTRSFLSAAAAALRAFQNGKTLLFDEIDCSLHPKLTEALISLFADKRLNKHGAQLLFTAHMDSIMDLLRRDQIWITEKKVDGASTLGPLSDYSLRKGEKKSKGYGAGRYGGIPVIDSLFEAV